MDPLVKAVELAKAQLAETVGLRQEDLPLISFHLRTLARFIEAGGGELRISAVYGDRRIDLNLGDL